VSADLPSQDLGRQPLAFAGALTIACIAHQHARLCAWLEVNSRQIDLSGVTECDAAGVQLLIAARRTAATLGNSLELSMPSAAVLEACRRCGVTLTH